MRGPARRVEAEDAAAAADAAGQNEIPIRRHGEALGVRAGIAFRTAADRDDGTAVAAAEAAVGTPVGPQLGDEEVGADAPRHQDLTAGQGLDIPDSAYPDVSPHQVEDSLGAEAAVDRAARQIADQHPDRPPIARFLEAADDDAAVVRECQRPRSARLQPEPGRDPAVLAEAGVAATVGQVADDDEGTADPEAADQGFRAGGDDLAVGLDRHPVGPGFRWAVDDDAGRPVGAATTTALPERGVGRAARQVAGEQQAADADAGGDHAAVAVFGQVEDDAFGVLAHDYALVAEGRIQGAGRGPRRRLRGRERCKRSQDRRCPSRAQLPCRRHRSIKPQGPLEVPPASSASPEVHGSIAASSQVSPAHGEFCGDRKI